MGILTGQEIDFLADTINDSVFKKIQNYFSFEDISVQSLDKHVYGNNLLLEYNKCSKTTILFCKLCCSEAKDVAVGLMSEATCKLWINQQPLLLLDDTVNGNCFVSLHSGDNLLLLEIFPFKIDTTVGIRISPFCLEPANSNKLLEVNNVLPRGTVTLHYSSNECCSGKEFCILPLVNDCINVQADQVAYIYLYLKDQKTPVYKWTIILNNAITVKLPIFYGFAVLQCSYFTKNGEQKTTQDILFAQDISFIENELCNNAQQILEFADDYNTSNLVELYYHFQKSRYHYNGKKDQANNILQLDYYIYKENAFTKVPVKYPQNMQYYMSVLDKKPYCYRLILPDDFQKNYSYSLIVFLTTYDYENQLMLLENTVCKGFITAIINCRGFTMGNYIGEATIQETIADIKYKYTIDDNKIFLVGFSNTASAVWAQLQAYPQQFIGGLTISGAMDVKALGNLWNNHIVNISSVDDNLYEKGYLAPQRVLRLSPNYVEFLANQMSHWDLENFQLDNNLINIGIPDQLDYWPKKVNYYTCRNRHNRGYWLCIDGIAYEKKEAQIQGILENHSKICITVENASGFTVTIPPEIQKDSFTILVNNKLHAFFNYQYDIIHFQRIGDEYLTKEQSLQVDFRKGTGLLDIYLGPLQILLPKNSDLSLKNIAQNLAHPHSNGLDSEIKIDYPINEVDFVQDCLPNSNFAIINYVGRESKFDSVMKDAPIHLEKNAFFYKNKQYMGDYCIMQIFPHPENNKYSILTVSFNNERVLRQNLFLRRMVIPSYLYGIHQYLNNMALIFYNQTYYSIYEWGMNLEEIRNNESR